MEQVWVYSFYYNPAFGTCSTKQTSNNMCLLEDKENPIQKVKQKRVSCSYLYS